MQQMTPMILMAAGVLFTLVLVLVAFAGPSAQKAQSRRITGIRERHGGANVAVEAQMRRVISNRPVASTGLKQFIPNPAVLAKRIAMTGKSWTVGQYLMASGAIMIVVGGGALAKGAPVMLGLLVGFAMGMLLPHMVVGFLISKRAADFVARFPDAIELMVRGLRSGLPISETLSIVSTEVPGAVGVEFQMVTDKMKIGRTMDEALQSAAERLGMPEFQFFVITLAIQRETGGNLAETLSNLAEVLRKRGQMKLKIKAMSSESKASAYIIGSLPFIVFILIYMVSPDYVGGFFKEERLMIAGGFGLIWMSIGGFIMAKMVNFEI
jgi:tight adherence protein B